MSSLSLRLVRTWVQSYKYDNLLTENPGINAQLFLSKPLTETAAKASSENAWAESMSTAVALPRHKHKMVKVPLYARFNIPEVWIVDVQGQVVECFWDPKNDGSGAKYVQSERADQEQPFVSAKTLNGIKLDLNELWIKH